MQHLGEAKVASLILFIPETLALFVLLRQVDSDLVDNNRSFPAFLNL